MALLLKGARLIDPRVRLDRIGDVLVRDGRIVEVGDDISLKKGEVVDLHGKVMVPGFVDLHVHLREPGFEYKETIESGTRAAAHGGFTAVCAMPNTRPACDTAAAVEAVLSRAEETAHTHVYPYGAITQEQRGERLAEMADMKTAGAVGFSDDGSGVQNSKMMRTAMEYASMLDIPLMLHCEDESLVDGACINEGAASSRLGMIGSPPLAESLAVTRDVALATLTGCRIHLCHISTRGSIEEIRKAKASQVPVTCEATAHHLLLTDSDIDEEYDTNLKINPPLRSEDDRRALVEALLDGTIDAIASDHAPHAPHEKDREFDLAAYGTIGLETTVPLILDRFVRTNQLTMAQLVERMAHAPRAILGLEEVTLSAGSMADVTVLDLERKVTFDVAYFEGRSVNSAFLGKSAIGCATDVLIGGYWTMRDNEVVS